jgi:hypothetical protein
MTLKDFVYLDEIQQKEAISDGTHIATRYDEYHSIFLYQIEGFYVEVFYHREQNMIRRFKPFKSVERLRPYLRQIDISALI